MFTQDALQLLQSTAVQAEGVKKIDTFIPQLAVPGGISMEDAEHLQPGRSRFRGKYSTSALAEFNAYTKARHEAVANTGSSSGLVAGAGSTSVFVNADNGSAAAFFNLGGPLNPGHADDIAVLSLKHTAAYAALIGINGKQLKQRQLAEFLEDWFDIVTPIYPESSAEASAPSVSAAIAAVRDITIAVKGEQNSVQGDLNASRSALEEVEARSKKQLPSGFYFAASPYDGFLSRTFNLRLAVLPQEKDPLLTLRIVGLADVAEKIGKEFEDKVRYGVPDDVAVYRGSFSP